MRKILLIICLLVTQISIANDGAYFASGNHLIPIEECDISVQKEVLNIVRKGEFIYVTVDYTFYNTVDDKSIIVGFEAPSPSGDVNGYPVKGGHPYIHNFKVLMNGTLLKFKKAIVTEDNYFNNGKINAKKESVVITDDFNANDPEFYYVYYFNARFKKGENKIIHTYKFNASGSVAEHYNFDYILTAVNRWSNGQIDDFTLNINMGDDTYFDIRNTFGNSKDWTIENGRRIDNFDNEATGFVINKGGITFKKKNFSPKGELFLKSVRDFVWSGYDVFNSKIANLPANIRSYDGNFNITTKSVDEKSFKILRNLPFAIKGYVFKTKFIQDYYLRQLWYRPNPDYKIKGLQGVDLEWYNEVLQNKWEN